MFRAQVGMVGPGVAVAAEQYRTQGRERVIVEARQRAYLLQGVEQFQFAPLAQFSEQGLRGAPAHGAEGVEAAGRVAIESFLEKFFGLFRPISQRKGAAGT